MTSQGRQRAGGGRGKRKFDRGVHGYIHGAGGEAARQPLKPNHPPLGAFLFWFGFFLPVLGGKEREVKARAGCCLSRGT